MDYNKIAELKFYCDDLQKELTIKNYLKELLTALWEREDGFSGKRPFGNGAWKYGVYECLIKNGFVDGSLDEDGYVEKLDDEQADKIILDLIKHI